MCCPYKANLIVVKDHSRIVVIAFLNESIAQQDSEHVNLGVVGYFHGFLRYRSILVVR